MGRACQKEKDESSLREAPLHEYGRILAGKKLWGVAFKKARKLMAERGLTNEAEAIAISRAEQVQAVRKWGRRALALAYAVKRAQANAKRNPLIFSAQTVVANVFFSIQNGSCLASLPRLNPVEVADSSEHTGQRINGLDSTD